MKKVVFTILLAVASQGFILQTAKADDSQALALKEEVVQALVQIFNGEINTTDPVIENLKASAEALPKDDHLSNEIRAALAAVAPNQISN